MSVADTIAKIKAQAQLAGIQPATPSDPQVAELLDWARKGSTTFFDGGSNRQVPINTASPANVSLAIKRLKAAGLNDYIEYNNVMSHDLAVNLARGAAIFQSIVGDTAGGSAYYRVRGADQSNADMAKITSGMKDTELDPTSGNREGFWGEGGIGEGSTLLTSAEKLGSAALKTVTGGAVDVDLTKLSGNNFLGSLENVGKQAAAGAVSSLAGQAGSLIGTAGDQLNSATGGMFAGMISQAQGAANGFVDSMGNRIDGAANSALGSIDHTALSVKGSPISGAVSSLKGNANSFYDPAMSNLQNLQKGHK